MIGRSGYSRQTIPSWATAKFRMCSAQARGCSIPSVHRVVSACRHDPRKQRYPGEIFDPLPPAERTRPDIRCPLRAYMWRTTDSRLRSVRNARAQLACHVLTSEAQGRQFQPAHPASRRTRDCRGKHRVGLSRDTCAQGLQHPARKRAGAGRVVRRARI